jgi:dihydroneopterin aldolase
MTTETTQAFAHPEARAEASAGPALPDRISLRDHVVTVEIGAFRQERGTRQRLRFNMVVELGHRPAPVHDDVDRILSYDRLTEAIATELAAERLNLLETLAERIAARILAEPQALRAFVRIEKLDRGPGALGVEIVRARTDQMAAQAAPAPQPIVAFLDPATLAAPGLPARLDALQARGAPVILALGPPDLPRPVTGEAASQRHIDLLAIEQNAWALAARTPRCTVVATRTEIDWAMRNGQMIIWAPAKLVLDAVDGPAGTDPVGLALWLAGQLNAKALVLHGPVTAPAGSRVPVERA